jgi:sec-independent protein translocase protein TatB
MLNLDPAKLLVIAVVAIILLGPDRLPVVARQVGGFWRTFNDYRHRMESQVRESMPDLPSTAELTRLARSPSALLDHISTMGSDSEKEAAPLVSPASPVAAQEAQTTEAPTQAVAHRAPRPTGAPPETSSPESALPGDPGLN